MVSSVSEKFWQSIAAIRDDIVARVKPVRGTVNELTSGKIVLVRSINDPADRDEAEYARIRGFNVNVGEDVYALSLGDGQQLLVLGALQNSSPTAYGLDAPLSVAGSIMATGALTAGDITGTAFNSPLVQTEAQSSSDVASTTSAVNFSAAITIPVSLGTGMWSVHAQGGLNLRNSNGAAGQMQVNIDGNEGTIRTLGLDINVMTMCVSEHQLAGRTGTINVTVRFKSSTSGTTFANNPWLIIIARRVS